jgi:nucleoside-diphosphate-sugar epimerase
MADVTAAGEQAADRILLTGATGYVGGRMLRKLEELGRPVRSGSPARPHISPGLRTLSRNRAEPAHSARSVKLLMSKSDSSSQ